MRLWMTILALLSTPLYADFETSQISNFTGQYVQDYGQATAEIWQLPGKASYQNVAFEIYKEETSLRLVHPEGEQVFEEIPDSILEIEKLILNQIYHSTLQNRIDTSADTLEGFSPQNHVKVQSLKLSCKKNSNLSSEWKKVIDACSSDGGITIAKIVIEEKSRSNQTIASFLKELFQKTNLKLQSDTEITNFKFSVVRNKFKIEAKVKLDISINVTVIGDVEYVPHGEKNIIKLRIDKVKAGFLNITDKVFTALEKRQGPHMSVQRPYVYVNF